MARLAFGRDERWPALALGARAGRLAWFLLEPDEHGQLGGDALVRTAVVDRAGELP